MDRGATNTLTPEQAKARLREAAQELGVNHWVGQHTWRVLALALVGGYVVGHLRIPALMGTRLVQRVLPVLLTTWLRRKK